MSVAPMEEDPDGTEYVELELVDIEAQELVDNALDLMADHFPGWQPREGNTEVVLIEALAREAIETVFAINEVPPQLLERLLLLFGYSRSEGAPPTATVRFTVLLSAEARTIPAGTNIVISETNTDEPAYLVTDADLTIAAGQTTGVIAVSAQDATGNADGTPTGTALDLVDSLSYVESVVLASPLSGGSPPEDADAFLARAAPGLNRLTSTLVLGPDIERYVLASALAYRARVIDLYDAARPAILPGGAPGFVTVAVAGVDGVAYSQQQLAAIQSSIRTQMHAGIMVRVVNTNTVAVNVTVTVLKLAGADDTEVRNSVDAKLRTYLDADTWQWSTIVRRNELIAVVDGAAGVDAVIDITTPAADIVLAGVAPLVKPGTITVTVVEPS